MIAFTSVVNLRSFYSGYNREKLLKTKDGSDSRIYKFKNVMKTGTHHTFMPLMNLTSSSSDL